MASRDRKADAEEAKARGNEALAGKEWDKAIDNYTIAIKLVEDPVYYSNRSAAYLSKGFAESALKDAIKEANRKAALMAEAAGAKILRLLSVTADEAATPLADNRGFALARASVPIAAGERTISASATLVFEIAPK